MALKITHLFLFALSISVNWASNEFETDAGQTPSSSPSATWIPRSSPKALSHLALAVARSTYLPTDRFSQNGSIMENPSHFGKSWVKCPKSKPEMQAGLCYKPCNRSSWAFVKGVGPVCWGCPESHPDEHLAMCYKECRGHKLKGRLFLCFGDCPSGYRNDGLTCFRDARFRTANTANCPWYDKCGLTFSRGCSKCPAGYKNDGCICRRNPHMTVRPRYNRGIGVAMKSYGRGTGVLPDFFRYDPTSERIACRTKDWVGTAFVNEDAEVVKFVNHRQKIVVFGFRGTEVKSISDWLVNLDFQPEEFVVNNTRLKAHRGFKNRYDHIASWFEKEYMNTSRKYSIVLTGHNQGGAQASLAAVFAAGKLARAPNAVITWGSPLVGALNFRNFYRKYVGCDVTVNYVTKGDIIATIPKVHGYAHACDVVELEARHSDFIRSHSLYSGYGKGLERAYGDIQGTKSGCDVPMTTKNDVLKNDLPENEVSENEVSENEVSEEGFEKDGSANDANVLGYF